MLKNSSVQGARARYNISMHTIKDGIEHLRKNDPILAPIIASSPKPAITPHHDYYGELVSSIISQQLSVKAAASIQKRVMQLYNDRLPAPKEILATSAEQLRECGLSRPKISYMQDLATRVLEGTLNFKNFDELSNDQIISELTAVKGVGEWTAHMFLLFCMGRLDILPTGDLGIRNGVKYLYGLEALPDAHAIQEISAHNNWHPYESVAAWYVWQAYGNKPPTA